MLNLHALNSTQHKNQVESKIDWKEHKHTEWTKNKAF